MMARETEKTKTDAAPKNEPAPKKEPAPKQEAAPADKSTAGAEAPKAEDGNTAAAAPSGYSRGEGQKPVTKAYKDNWDAIFAKKKKR
jgi:hypothetical protein